MTRVISLFAVESHKHRANANKLLARALDFIQRNITIRVCSLKGGTARNAIPRDAEAIFMCHHAMYEKCPEVVQVFESILKSEYSQSEKSLFLEIVEIKYPVTRAINAVDTMRCIQLLSVLPNGVAEMSAEVEGFVETSNNIGIMELTEDGFCVVSNQRSTYLSILEEMAHRIEFIGELVGAKIEHTKIFPSWKPNLNSDLLKKCQQIYEAQFGIQPMVNIVHGGLECGVISDRCGGLDSISLGPTIQNPHSPDERLYVPSIEKVWKFLAALLKSF